MAGSTGRSHEFIVAIVNIAFKGFGNDVVGVMGEMVGQLRDGEHIPDHLTIIAAVAGG